MARVQAHKEIALQAGVGLATVDRVLHERGGVRAATVRRVRQAIEELDSQRLQATRSRHRLVVDLVMDAPARFAHAVTAALLAELPALPAAVRVRHHLTETAQPHELARTLAAIARRGSHGVILKAPDLPQIAEAIRGLADAGVPTVTFVTDVAGAPRLAAIGIDDEAAGRTAAWLVAARMGEHPGHVLVTLSSHRFHGEERREVGFREALASLAPALAIVRIDEGRGLDRATGALAAAALAADPAIVAVYSIGGGNAAIRDAFRAAGRVCRVFVGHDLDADNRALLADGGIDAVLEHDLRANLRDACLVILQARRLLPRTPAPAWSQVGIVTRFNLPP